MCNTCATFKIRTQYLQGLQAIIRKKTVLKEIGSQIHSRHFMSTQNIPGHFLGMFFVVRTQIIQFYLPALLRCATRVQQVCNKLLVIRKIFYRNLCKIVYIHTLSCINDKKTHVKFGKWLHIKERAHNYNANIFEHRLNKENNLLKKILPSRNNDIEKIINVINCHISIALPSLSIDLEGKDPLVKEG